MEIVLKLSVEEVNSLLNLLGQMQNSSGTYPLLMKIRDQGLEQVKSPAVEPVAT